MHVYFNTLHLTVFSETEDVSPLAPSFTLFDIHPSNAANLVSFAFQLDSRNLQRLLNCWKKKYDLHFFLLTAGMPDKLNRALLRRAC